MKRIVFLLILVFTCMASNAQKKSGTVYSEHANIDLTKAMWAAITQGDKDAFLNSFTDSVYLTVNGEMAFKNVPKANMMAYFNFWGKLNNLKVSDDVPATPDAIDYNGDSFWIQDWQRISGTDTASGINVDLPVHCLYLIDKNGKIRTIHNYFDNDIFEEINNSTTTKDNGKVYINHPYIVSVRKVMNAIYIDKDLDRWAEFFSPNTRFGSSTMKWGETIDLETKKEQLKEYTSDKLIKIRQVGYPDCIYYAKGDSYVVYSWWIISEIDGENIKEIPIMISHNFNKEGKIAGAYLYVSSNHFE